MENLPTEIIETILSSLPIEPALQSKRVCTTWRNLVGNNKTGLLFAYADLKSLTKETGAKVELYYGDQYEANLQQYYSNETLTKFDRLGHDMRATYSYCHDYMVGSCNGLVCLHLYSQVSYAPCCGICNPVTGEFLFLPGLTKPKDPECLQIGFGYLPSTNEYKVVKCSYKDVNCMRQGHVEVYTLGSQNGWRGKEKIPYTFRSSGMLANGAIHWIDKTYERDRPLFNIVAYDLVNEKFKHVPSPPLHCAKRHDDVRLMLLGGNLCVVHHKGQRDQIIDIWAFKKRNENTRILRARVTEEEYYDRNWSWSKEFSITFDTDPKKYDYMPVAITKNNDVLLWHLHMILYRYDNKTSTLTKVWEWKGKGSSCIQAIPHMNTLVSLKDLGECCTNTVTCDNDESKCKKRKRKC